jgi:NAD(P)-dependent dehydrogenase (short-subunit alcohol dehydrogenase family)
VVVSDASDYEAVKASAEEIAGALGPIDVLVNVAGASEPRPFQELVPADFERMFQTNVASAWAWSHCVVPGMIERKNGRIVNMSSISGKHGGGPPASVSRSAYASAKAGVIGLTKGLARELAPHVTVNCVCPGLIATDRTRDIIDGPQKDVVTGMIPMGRPGRPEEVAAAILYLVSPGAAWVTGTSLDVNGGQWMS